MKKVIFLAVLFYLIFDIGRCLFADEQSEYLFSKKAFKDGISDVAVRKLYAFLDDYPQSQNAEEVRLMLGEAFFRIGK